MGIYVQITRHSLGATNIQPDANKITISQHDYVSFFAGAFFHGCHPCDVDYRLIGGACRVDDYAIDFWNGFDDVFVHGCDPCHDLFHDFCLVLFRVPYYLF